MLNDLGSWCLWQSQGTSQRRLALAFHQLATLRAVAHLVVGTLEGLWYVETWILPQAYILFSKIFGASPVSFSFIFSLFQTNNTQNLHQINVKKCPSSSWCQDLNSQPSEYESPPLTTSPGLPPNRTFLVLLLSFGLLWATEAFINDRELNSNDILNGPPQYRLPFHLQFQNQLELQFSNHLFSFFISYFFPVDLSITSFACVIFTL